MASVVDGLAKVVSRRGTVPVFSPNSIKVTIVDYNILQVFPKELFQVMSDQPTNAGKVGRGELLVSGDGWNGAPSIGTAEYYD